MKKSLKKLNRKAYNQRFLIGMCIIITLFFINSVISQEVLSKEYNKNSQTISLKQDELKIADIKLNTPLFSYVEPEYSKVAEFEITSYDYLKDFISKVNFYNAKEGNSKITRNYDIKYFVKTGETDIEELESNYLETLENGTEVYIMIPVKRKINTGYWAKFDNTIPSGRTIKIGIFMNVKEGQKIDWIPYFFDTPINEWAFFEGAKTDILPITFFVTSSPITYENCAGFQALKNITLNQVGIKATGNNCTIRVKSPASPYNDLGTYVYQATIVNKVCNITTSVNVSEFQYFQVCVNNYTGSYSFDYNITSNNYSLDNVKYINWYWGNTGTFGSGAVIIVNNITTQHFLDSAIVLNYPANNSNQLRGSSTPFNCTFLSNTPITNISFWSNSTGTFSRNITNDTSSLGLTEITNIFYQNFNNGTFKWACELCSNGVCLLSEENRTINFLNYFLNSENYNLNVTEGSIQTFSLNITTPYNINLIKLNYDNVNYTPSMSFINGNYIVTRDLLTPAVTTDLNKSFYWILTLDDGNTYKTTNYTQRINNLVIDNCTAYKFNVINLTLYDEETQLKINSSLINGIMEIDYYIYSSDGELELLHYYKKFSDFQNLTKGLCLNKSLTGIDNFLVKTQVKYYADGYVPEYYNIRDYPINATNYFINLSLYSLNNTLNTDFLITIKDKNYLTINEAIILIKRKYVYEGEYKIVEAPISDRSGQAIGHFNKNGVIYTLVVMKNNIVLATFDNIAVFCEDEIINKCNINLNIPSSISEFYNFESKNNLKYSMSFNETTRKIDVYFIVTDGIISTISFNATKFDNYGNQSVCSDSLYSSEGTLSCTIPESYGNTSIIVNLYKNGELIVTSVYSITPDLKEIWGNDGYILTAILVMCLALLFTPSYIGMIIGTILGLIVATTLMIIKAGNIFGSVSFLLWIIVAGIILIWRISKRSSGGSAV